MKYIITKCDISAPECLSIKQGDSPYSGKVTQSEVFQNVPFHYDQS